MTGLFNQSTQARPSYYDESRDLYGGVYLGEPAQQTMTQSRASYFSAAEEPNWPNNRSSQTSNLNRILYEQAGLGNYNYWADLVQTTRKELAGALVLMQEELEQASTNLLKKSGLSKRADDRS